MTINTRKRISINEDLQKAKEFVRKPKRHKICVNVCLEDYKTLKKKAVDNDTNVTEILDKMIKDYINDHL